MIMVVNQDLNMIQIQNNVWNVQNTIIVQVDINQQEVVQLTLFQTKIEQDVLSVQRIHKLQEMIVSLANTVSMM